MGYLSEDTFQENNLLGDTDQDRYIAEDGCPVFGTVEVDSAHYNDSPKGI